ncbi:hypothetical protein C8F04DRAFT_1183233 [Mycena alexandri]|uniref:Uncharacterized protein n=1 Tax=Mycena alexandri TaxID=1745969 RepID=A0AAD6X6X8_9AGAR|nr:hypothetical protein C8F04DRAFT_1183233 [Mycena alexandri]
MLRPWKKRLQETFAELPQFDRPVNLIQYLHRDQYAEIGLAGQEGKEFKMTQSSSGTKQAATLFSRFRHGRAASEPPRAEDTQPPVGITGRGTGDQDYAPPRGFDESARSEINLKKNSRMLRKLIQTSKMPLSDLKRKLDSEAQDVRQLAPAFREQHSNAERHFVRITLPVSWSHSDMIPSSESSSTSVTFFRFNANIVNLLPIQADTSSPRTSPIPGLQADLRAIGMHSTPWSQLGNSNRSFLLQSSPAIVSTRLTPTSGMPATLDSLRTTDPRKTPTTTTTTRITQTQISTVQQQIDLGLPKRPRAMPIPAKPQAPVHEGPRLPSEIRKRTISLTAKPVRSSPRHLGSRRKDNDEQVEVEAGEIRTGYSSGTSSESDSS